MANLITGPIQRLVKDLADSPRVQEFLGVSTSREAANRIHVDGLPEPPPGHDAQIEQQLITSRPYLLVFPSESDSYRIRNDATPNSFDLNGSIEIVCSRDYPSNKTPTEAWNEIANEIGEMISSSDPSKKGILDYLGIAERFQVREVEVHMAGRTPPQERATYGDCYDVLLTLRY